MQQFNFPTTIVCGQGALVEACRRISLMGLRKPLLVSDATLHKVGLVSRVEKELISHEVHPVLFARVQPNPTDDDVLKGAEVYRKTECDSVVALGGGSPMDAAKAMMIAATHDGALAQFDDLKGGDKLIINPLPPLFAIPTTAGTGSEVGRSGLIVMRETGLKTIFFHPNLMPKLAVLDPELTIDLPPMVTATTGIDAFSHALEGFLARTFHPMCDGIAVEAMTLVLRNLPKALADGHDLEARERLLLAASMGATSFQKGLGVIHSIAHALGGECHLHHGTGISLVMPWALKFLEDSDLSAEQRHRLERVQNLFVQEGLAKNTLSASVKSFIESCGVKMGLKNHGIAADKTDVLVEKAWIDPCHPQGLIDVSQEDIREIIDRAM